MTTSVSDGVVSDSVVSDGVSTDVNGPEPVPIVTSVVKVAMLGVEPVP